MRSIIYLALLVSVSCGGSDGVQEPEAPAIPVPDLGATRIGYDALGLARYCEEFLQAPLLPALSTLQGTFGNPLPCVERRIALGGLEVVQVDLIDATCHRNKVCTGYAPKSDDLVAIKRRAGQVNELAVKYPDVEFWISPALEHDVKDIARVEAMFQAAREGCPNCAGFLNSRVSGAAIAGVEDEKHGTKTPGFSVSSDGASIFDGDNIRDDGNNFQHRLSATDQMYAWFPEMNLRCTGEEKFVHPTKRTEKPSLDLLRQAYFILVGPEPEKPVPPPQCVSVRDITPGREINKPNAEHYCNGQPEDDRGNKPLLIIEAPGVIGDRLQVFSADGNAVAEFCYYAKYKDLANTHRWYMGNCSGHTPTQLLEVLGGEWGFAQLPDGACIRFNAIRRQGIYR